MADTIKESENAQDQVLYLKRVIAQKDAEISHMRSFMGGALSGPYKVSIDELVRTLRLCVSAVDAAPNGHLSKEALLNFEAAKYILSRSKP